MSSLCEKPSGMEVRHCTNRGGRSGKRIALTRRIVRGLDHRRNIAGVLAVALFERGPWIARGQWLRLGLAKQQRIADVIAGLSCVEWSAVLVRIIWAGSVFQPRYVPSGASRGTVGTPASSLPRQRRTAPAS